MFERLVDVYNPDNPQCCVITKDQRQKYDAI